MKSPPDKIRLHFWHEGKFHEKYIIIDYPKEVIDIKEFRMAYAVKALKNWYEEVTGLNFPNSPIPMRDIRYSKGTAEEAILNLDGRN